MYSRNYRYFFEDSKLEFILRVNETKITTKKVLHWDNFVTEGNQELRYDKKTVLSISANP